jgi:hypothetical protein
MRSITKDEGSLFKRLERAGKEIFIVISNETYIAVRHLQSRFEHEKFEDLSNRPARLLEIGTSSGFFRHFNRVFFLNVNAFLFSLFSTDTYCIKSIYISYKHDILVYMTSLLSYKDNLLPSINYHHYISCKQMLTKNQTILI